MFKEDCSDLRNSKVIDIIHELQSFGAAVLVHVPQADPEEALHEYRVALLPCGEFSFRTAVVAAAAHREFRSLTAQDLCHKVLKTECVADMKSADDQATI